MLSLIHVLAWRAAIHPDAIALSDQQGAELTYASLAAAVERSAAGFDPAELVSWARERLAGFKCPTGVTVVPELPRNATGKVVRAALRQPFWAGRDRLVS